MHSGLNSKKIFPWNQFHDFREIDFTEKVQKKIREIIFHTIIFPFFSPLCLWGVGGCTSTWAGKGWASYATGPGGATGL